ncbi:MAG TPA: CHAT domain-containing tetratricopeptide repeat protein [Candidatus Polarisedimenticolaceae bacterium]|nr:CHAT domain-containing tetratricopeptide repeat protein [Candidatus Polarisedimenticolaceae bacterium]
MLFAGAALLPAGDTVKPDDSGAVREARARVHGAELREGARSLQVAEELSRLQRLLQDSPQANAGEGTALARRALAIAEAHFGPEDARTADKLDDVAWWLWLQRDYRGERPLVERALRIRERVRPVDERKLATDLHLLAEIAFVEGDFGRALQLHERAQPLWERACGEHSACMALHHLRLGRVHEQLGHGGRARELTERAVAIYEEVLPTRNGELPRSLNLLGRLLIDTDPDRAEEVLARARDLWAVSGASRQGETAGVLRSLAWLAAKRGDLGGAIALYRQVLDIHLARLGPGHPAVGQVLAEMGGLQRRNGDLAAAHASLSRALDLVEKNELRAYPTWAAALLEQALLERDEGRLNLALGEALDAERISRAHFQAGAAGLSEDDALDQARERVTGLNLAWFLAEGLERRGELDDTARWRLLDEAIRSRALVLDTFAARNRTLALRGDEETAARAEALRVASQRLARLSIVGSEQELARARAEAQRAERALAERGRASPDAPVRGQPGVREVQRALPGGSVLVSFFRHGEGTGGYLASVLLPGDLPPRLIPLGSAAVLEASVETWLARISRDPRMGDAEAEETAYRAAARRLAELIWDPLAPFLGGADRVLVVPDGALHDVSLATLAPAGGGYLADTGLSFHYLTAERDLVVVDGPVPSAPGLLALGDPGTGLTPLPGSRLEVLDVAGRWTGPTTILLGSEAQESAFKELAPSSGVLHVAAHAFRIAEVPGESPLRVAGLVLSGGSDASDPDDGILTAEEVTLLDLRAVRWAVLSGCATGQGALEPGEGVLGLRRAFQLAGARTLIVSLWPVEDDATRHWMRALYTARRSGASTVEAVRAAVHSTLCEQRRTGGTTHPYFWGGFVSIGDWR